MKTYEGKRSGDVNTVTVDGSPLPPRNYPMNDGSPNFSWGDDTPGAKNLAYSILVDAIGEDDENFYCDELLDSVVSKFNRDQWKLTEKDVTEFCDHLASIRSSIPIDAWTDAGSGATAAATIPIGLPKIASDPNYHVDEDKKK